MESRKNSRKLTTRLSKSSELPVDYTRGVREVYATNFDEGLAALASLQKVKNHFEVRGTIFADEIVLAVSLVSEGVMAATTVHASVDFDPKASSPTATDLLNLCMDGVGSVFARLLDPTEPATLEKLTSTALGDFDEIPLEWTKVDFEGKRVWLFVDRSNPTLDELADDWLTKNDPLTHAEEEEYEEETKDNFMTGKDGKKYSTDDDEDGEGGGQIH
ncbi:MAG: hypothetical protein H7301_14540 [Cryobacterium sp.]|nr:hypothetical protein [Oligoflexia bacterium]